MAELNSGTRAALAVISGLALAAAFPKFELSLLAWVAFVPLLYAIRGAPPGRVLLYAWLQGFACAVASVYWIAITLHNFTSLRLALAVLPMLALAAVLGLFTGAALAVSHVIATRLRLPTALTLPLAWTACEWLRTYFPIGFPWNLLGYAAYRNLMLIQFAEFTGTYGVSALIIFANAVVYDVGFRIHSRRTQALSLGALTALLLAAFSFGALRMRQLAASPRQGPLKVAMVQGNIPQAIKWDPRFLQSSFDVYETQTIAAARRGADLIVWPEAAAAFFFQPEDRYPAAFAQDASFRRRLLALASATRTPLLFGAPALGVEGGRVGFYNRAYLVTGDGRVGAWYDKIQLVPFGEYVPLRSLFGSLVNRVVAGFGDMFAGHAQTLFAVKDARFGVLICYESIFPDLARRAVRDGAEVLVNITNDAWYGDSSAPYQLLAMSALRAVETKVPLLRTANTGISALIEPTGRIVAPTPLFTRGTQTAEVYWRRELTVYARFGDWFAGGCAIVTLIGFVLALIRPRTPLPPESESPLQRYLSANGSR